MPSKHTQNAQGNALDTCHNCNDSIKENDMTIKCRKCTKSAHHRCLNITKAIANFLHKTPTFPYICQSCSPNLNSHNVKSDNIHTLETTSMIQQTNIENFENKIEARLLARLETRFTSLEKTIQALTNTNPYDKIHTLEATTMTQQTNIENFEKKLETRLLDCLETRFTSLENKIQALTNTNPIIPFTIPPTPPQPLPQLPANSTINIDETVKEAIEREQKRHNAILFGLEENEELDITKVRDIINNNHVQTIASEEIIEVSRVGPTYRNNDGSVAPRFCRVVCKNESSKRKFIHAINSIARSNNDHNKLRSRPDLTLIQRIRSRELRAELKRRQELGETNLYIDYRAELIKNKTRNPSYNIQPTILQQQSNIPHTTNHD